VLSKKCTVPNIYRVKISTGICTKLVVCALKSQEVYYLKWDTLYVITSLDSAFQDLLCAVHKVYSP